MSEHVLFKCPECEAPMRASPEEAGTGRDCPSCGWHVEVPGASSAWVVKGVLFVLSVGACLAAVLALLHIGAPRWLIPLALLAEALLAAGYFVDLYANWPARKHEAAGRSHEGIASPQWAAAWTLLVVGVFVLLLALLAIAAAYFMAQP